MQRIKAVVVENEPMGMKNLLFKLENYCPEIEVVAECNSGKKAIQKIKSCQPDVVFLDIKLGDMNGFDVLKAVSYSAFKVIVTTSYDNYAIQAIKNKALDFLLKPIDEDELVAAKDRLVEEFLKKSPVPKRVGLPVANGEKFVDTDKILYLITDKNRARSNAYVLKSGDKNELEEIQLTRILGEMESRLARHGFGRPNQQCLVNLSHVDEFIRGDGGWVIMSNGKHFNIGGKFKDSFHEFRTNWMTGM